MDRPELTAVLAEVNRLRAERGMKPLSKMPKGILYEPSACPLAYALRSPGVVPGERGGFYRFALNGERFALPEVLNAFGLSFDGGAYPELVA